MSVIAPVIFSLLLTGQGAEFAQPVEPGMQPQLRREPVVGTAEHQGYVLIGARGRHYIFGGLAVADYVDANGRRRIVSLEEQKDSAALPDTETFLYFRELGSGNRWSISRRAGNNGRYSVFFQPYVDPRSVEAARIRPQWQAFHQADYREDASLARPDAGRGVPEGGTARVDPRFDNTVPRLDGIGPGRQPGFAAAPGSRFVQPGPALQVFAESSSSCCGQ